MSTLETSVTMDGLPNPRRTLAFLTVSLAIVMAVLDGSIVNVALPVIAAEYQTTPSSVIWVVTAYQLAVVVSLLPLAALGEAIGFRKVYIGGLALFVVASLLCANANSLVTLSLARVLQGLGAGALMSINGALVRYIMPTSHLGRGLSGTALVVGISAAAGPSVAAAILAVSSWHWLFLINVPLGILTLLAGRLTLPETPKSGVPFDFLSAILNAGTFGFLISGISSISNGSPMILVATQLLAALAAGILLARRQLSRSSPMLPVDLLRLPDFARPVLASVCVFTAQFLALISLPFFFHDVLGRSEVATGFLLTPWPVTTAIMAVLMGRLTDRFSPVRLSSAGLVVFAGGLALLGFLTAEAGDADIIWRLALCGFGFGLFQSPNNKAMIVSAPRHRSGGASGMQSTARLLGQSFGAALGAILMSGGRDFSLPLLMWTGAGFALLAALVTAWGVRTQDGI